jgi:hypothetical protein
MRHMQGWDLAVCDPASLTTQRRRALDMGARD